MRNAATERSTHWETVGVTSLKSMVAVRMSCKTNEELLSIAKIMFFK